MRFLPWDPCECWFTLQDLSLSLSSSHLWCQSGISWERVQYSGHVLLLWAFKELNMHKIFTCRKFLFLLTLPYQMIIINKSLLLTNNWHYNRQKIWYWYYNLIDAQNCFEEITYLSFMKKINNWPTLVYISLGWLYLWVLVINMHNSLALNNSYPDFCHLPYLEE